MEELSNSINNNTYSIQKMKLSLHIDVSRSISVLQLPEQNQGAVMQLTIPANPNSSDIHYDWLIFRKKAQPYLRIGKDLSLMGPIVTILRVYSGKKRTTLFMKRQIRHL